MNTPPTDRSPFATGQIYYDKTEASVYTRHSPNTLMAAVRKGQLRACKPAQKVLFLRSDLDLWIRQRQLRPDDIEGIVDLVIATVEAQEAEAAASAPHE